MAPGQQLLDAASNSKAHSCMKFGPDEKRSLSFHLEGQGDRVMRNNEKMIVNVEAECSRKIKQPVISDDEDIDITGCAGTSETRLHELEDPDATEYSSSFGGTISSTEDCSGLSEAEAESGFFNDNSLVSEFDAFNNAFSARFVHI